MNSSISWSRWYDRRRNRSPRLAGIGASGPRAPQQRPRRFLGAVPPSQFRASGQSVDLYAEDGITEDDLWDRVDVGHEFVDVDGQVGFLTSGQDRQLLWVTADGVQVSIYYKGREDWQEALLDIARSVRPVPADDERLATAWQLR